jgi:hypothetical protein
VTVGLGVGVTAYVGVLVETGGGVVDDSAVSVGVLTAAVLTAATYEVVRIGARAATFPTATHATEARTTNNAE